MNQDTIEITVKLNEQHLHAMLKCFPPASLGTILVKSTPCSEIADKLIESIRKNPSVIKDIMEEARA